MHTILVADDSVTILKAVEIVFDKEPFQVVKAGSGAEAIARARELHPHLVLADHHMADKSGYEVAEALRADPSTSAIPVIILSGGAAAPYDEPRGRAAGVAGHVPKPFDCQTLLDRVRTLLGVAATAPGATVSVAAVAPASSMPRPPGVPGGIAANMPRPPSAAGQPRPGFPTSASPASAATPIARSPTPQPARADLDPFGFGASLATASTPPVPAQAASAPPRANNPFSSSSSSSTSIGGAAAAPMTASAPIVSQPMTAPASISAVSPAAQEPWKAGRGDVLDGKSSAPPSAAAPKTTAPSYVGESEFLEVGDIEVNDIPATPRPSPSLSAATNHAPLPGVPSVDAAKRTDKVSTSAIAELEAKRPAVTLEPVSAVEAVTEKAATIIAKTTGVVPSKELLTEEARQIIERVAWEVVPELAEVIIREEIQRLLKSRT